ncbi:MAG: porin [Pseudomonadota bacterium]
MSKGTGVTTVGGYGELLYNNLDSKKEMDFHRFVLFFNHDFSNRIRLFSELELEHALAADGKKGEVELEQAYVDFQLDDAHAIKGGLFLVPVGMLNETHEPPTFYGVERNSVENAIVPSTWWEAGVGLHGDVAPGLGYDLALTSGLNVAASGADAYNIRKGRQKVSYAKADDLAYTARLKWTGMPGVEIAGSLFYQDDLSQTGTDTLEGGLLTEVHAIVQQGPFGVRALYARWDLDGSGPKAVGADEQFGWYLEPSFRVNGQFGVFARYSAWDTKAGSSADTETKQASIGFNYWPHENVVVKADYQNETGKANDGFNLGIGYQF